LTPAQSTTLATPLVLLRVYMRAWVQLVVTFCRVLLLLLLLLLLVGVMRRALDG
jgi:hypothetical protein